MEGQEISTLGSGALEITAQDFKDRYKKIMSLMGDVMVEGQDYGKVPGCGDKPMLYKSGSEKLLLLFQLGANPIVEDLSTADNVHYRVKVEIIHTQTGRVIGYGIGEASSDEEKYKWRKAVCKQEYDETDPSRKRTVWKRGYQNNPPYQVEQVRTNPADSANTILKMAKKRSQTDGTLTTTGTSALYGQDLEDLNQEIAEYLAEEKNNEPAQPKGGKPAVQQPQAKSAYKPSAAEAPAAAKNETYVPKRLKPETATKLTEMMTTMQFNPMLQVGRLKWADQESVGDDIALESIGEELKRFQETKTAVK